MADTAEGAKQKGSKKGMIIPAVFMLIGIGTGGFFYMQSQSAKAAAPTTTTTVAGKIIRLDPITLNLSDGHVLKVGLALQMVDKPKNKALATVLAAAGGEGSSKSSSSTGTSSPLDGDEAKALDTAINDLGNMTFAQLSAPGGRAAAKDALAKKIEEAYEGDVTGVYYTDFVMS